MKKTLYAFFAMAFAALVVLPSPSKTTPQQSAVVVGVEAQNVVDLRAAIAKGGRVIVPSGRYYFLEPLVLRGTTSLIGDYRDLVTFDFTRMTNPDQEAMRIDRVWGYEIRNISIVGDRTKNAIGVLNSTTTPNANGSYGTCSGASVWDHVLISGFKKGLVIGNRDLYIAASENTYNHLQITRCGRCIEINDFNSLNHLFTMLAMGDCNEGLVTNGGSYITVKLGSISSCRGVCFDLGNCSSFTVEGFRVEDSGVFIRGGTTSTAVRITISGCMLHQSVNYATDNSSAFVNGWKNLVCVGGSAFLIMRDNFLSPTVNVPPVLNMHNSTGGLIEMTGNTCTVPLSVPLVSANNSTTERLFLKNNGRVNTGNQFQEWYPDLMK